MSHEPWIDRASGLEVSVDKDSWVSIMLWRGNVRVYLSPRQAVDFAEAVIKAAAFALKQKEPTS